MTTKEKAKAYDEAIKRAETFYDERGRNRLIAISIFPELQETEDGKILRKIVDGFRNWKNNGNYKFNNTPVDDIILYLEKLKSKDNKDFFKEGIGHYFFDGEKAHFCGSHAMETNED